MEEHAHHFLSRLDRLSLPHVELALSLYRDHELLKTILDSAKVPDAMDRVALSLADPKDGPFLVVTRNGKFVTCLGEGMRKGSLPVITRETLDGVAVKLEVLRGRMERARKLAGADGGVARLFRRVYDAGSRLSREDFMAASDWHPLLVMEFIRAMLDCAEDVHELKHVLIRQLKRSDKLDPRFTNVARGYYKCVWFIGHLAALAAIDGRLPFEELHPKAYEAMQEFPYAWSSVRQGLVSPAIRGIWGAARIGKMLLPRYKTAYSQAVTLNQVVESVYSLAAIGLRHSRLGAEVEKTLASPLPRSVGGEQYQKILNAVTGLTTAAFVIARDDPKDSLALHRKVGAEFAVQWAPYIKPGSRFKFNRPEDVPDDIAYAFPCNTDLEFALSWKHLEVITAVLPWMANAEAKDLYFPAEYLADFIPEGNTIDDAMALLLPLRDLDAASEPSKRTTPKGSARNEPCPCGSGIKYKRCCAQKPQGNVPAEKDEKNKP